MGLGGVNHNRQENRSVSEARRLTLRDKPRKFTKKAVSETRHRKKLMTWENIDIEILLRWAFRDQKIHIVMEGCAGLLPAETALDGLAGRNVSGDGCHAVRRNWELGVAVDEFQRGLGSAHPDAEAAYTLLREISIRHGGASPTADLIYRHALVGSRPDWMPGARTKVVKVLNGRGKQKMVYDRNRRAIACRISFENPPEMIDFCRKRYEVWHGGLSAMAAVFSEEPDRLIRHKVTGPEAFSQPWNQSKVEKK